MQYHRSSTGEENFLLDITELERSTFMAVPGHPGLIFIPEDWQLGGYWEYSTKASEIGCRGGFGIHPGTISKGCISVTNARASNLLTYIFVLYTSEFRTFQAFSVFPWLYTMYMHKKGWGWMLKNP